MEKYTEEEQREYLDTLTYAYVSPVYPFSFALPWKTYSSETQLIFSPFVSSAGKFYSLPFQQ